MAAPTSLGCPPLLTINTHQKTMNESKVDIIDICEALPPDTRNVNLKYKNLDDDDIKYFVKYAMEHFKMLKSCDLTGNKITDSGLYHLSDFCNNGVLVCVDKNKISHIGLGTFLFTKINFIKELIYPTLKGDSSILTDFYLLPQSNDSVLKKQD